MVKIVWVITFYYCLDCDIHTFVNDDPIMCCCFSLVLVQRQLVIMTEIMLKQL